MTPVYADVFKQITENARNNLFPKVSVILNIGHNIGIGPDGVLGLSEPAIPVEDTGFWPDGAKKYRRIGAGMYVPIYFLYISDQAIIGCGKLAIEASAHLFNTLSGQSAPPKLVVHTGGRPGYLENTPGHVTEAFYMYPAFAQLAKALVNQLVATTAKNTKDDMQAGLEAATRNSLSSMALVAMGIRLPRCKVFVDGLVTENPNYGKIQVSYLPAEMLIQHQMVAEDKTADWENFWSMFAKSKPYLRTLADEGAGYDAALAKQYKGTGDQ